LFFKVTGAVAAVLYGTRGVCQKEKMFCLNNSSLNNNNAIDKEQIRKRKEEEDRIAAQNEFLNRSLRGSRKLQALESRPQGSVNDAFAEDEAQESSRSTTPATAAEKEVVHTVYGYGDLVASVQRLQLQLKKAGAGGGLGGLEGRVAAVQSLLLSPQFGRALAVHNKVQTVRSRTTPRPAPTAQTALRDCLDALANSQSSYAVELASLLTGYELEALMVAHDGVASTLPADSTSPGVPVVEPPPQAVPDHRFQEENIKIIKIEKSTEPLGATVRNEGEAVVIGEWVSLRVEAGSDRGLQVGWCEAAPPTRAGCSTRATRSWR
jgi:MAGUK p55 subfamily protein 5